MQLSLYTVHSLLFTCVHCGLHTIPFLLFSVHFLPFTVEFTGRICGDHRNRGRTSECAIHLRSCLSTFNTVHSTVYITQYCTVYSIVQFTLLYSMKYCTVYTTVLYTLQARLTKYDAPYTEDS